MNSMMRFAKTQPLGAVGFLIILLILVAACAPQWLAPYDPVEIDFSAMLTGPSASHWLGADQWLPWRSTYP